MKRRVPTAVLAVAVIASLAAPAGAGAGSGPTATKSAESLVRYLTKGKLKVSKKIKYRVVCSTDCQLTATSTFVLKGPNLSATSTAAFAAGEVAEVFLQPNKALRNSIKENKGSSKLSTKVSATSTTTGEVDVDRRTYRFK